MDTETPSEGELIARSYFFYTVFGVVAFSGVVLAFILR